MRVNGLWVGWGLGDWSHYPDGSDRDPTVRQAKGFMRVKFRSYAGDLADTNVYDQQMFNAVWEMQRRYWEIGKLHEPTGILDLETQIIMGFKKPTPKVLPIIFTVEGHLSNMFAGPCAFTAQALEAQGVCHVKPIAYNDRALPFDNNSGIDQLIHQLSSREIEGPPIDQNNPDGPKIMWPFPPGTWWAVIIFSQGGIVGSEFLLRHVFPENGVLHWRLKDLKRSLAFGNPYRELNQCADWVPDPPRENTRGISDVRLDATKIILPNGQPFSTIHREVARHGDIYAENEVNDAGEMKTAIYKMVQGQWWGGSDSIFEQMLELFGPRMFQEAIAAFQATISGAMFVGNMGPHGIYDLGPCIEWMRGVSY